MIRPLLFLLLLTIPVLAQPHARHKRLKPEKTIKLPKELPEGSGIAAYNGQLWMHNDSGAAKIYSIDAATGKVITAYPLPKTENNDWEDIAQDAKYFFVGDIGNNAGTRDQLNILRIEKQSLLAQKPIIDTISFSWPETEIRGKKQQVNFDCEAMVTAGDSLYLFTKEWKKERCTRVFSIPRLPGKYVAKFKSKIRTRVLVTGAFFDDEHHRLLLIGYNLWLRPYLLDFSQFKGTDFFGGKCVKVKLRIPFRQTEGIATFDGRKWYVVNEDFHFWFLLHSDAELHEFILPEKW
ncbi:MAG: T9SS C-terminal target domain-containing protein [Flavobacterium sp.]|nr:MAG: T9SS C-terminal target domain-containing protein [Flavobacterium sp.]